MLVGSCGARSRRPFLHLVATVARVAGPGGARSVVAESVLVKHQLLILNRARKRSPRLLSFARISSTDLKTAVVADAVSAKGR